MKIFKESYTDDMDDFISLTMKPPGHSISFDMYSKEAEIETRRPYLFISYTEKQISSNPSKNTPKSERVTTSSGGFSIILLIILALIAVIAFTILQKR